ncbi:protein Hydra magnipapillata [Nesidiocoris tenuis]|nr:protein Hydra magnipapillata [Nesidiocoris tenuis]
MSAVQFESLLDLVKHQIVKRDTKFRAAIPPHDRLMVTLRFLASGDAYCSLQYVFRLPPCTISKIVPEATLKSLRDSKSLPALTEDWRPSRESKKSHFHL